ncbi:MAG: efflux RND transporter periplasmic adaptor subunit [Gammaproteobacteria bacterium]|nr:efflux RND transporter periplasmic adaptor subunit [Gammaproteobacteria bacterium]
MNKLPFIFSLTFFYAAILLPSELFAAGPPGGRESPVSVAVAQNTLLSPSVLVPGTVVSRFSAEVPAEVEGRMVWVAEVGQSVKKGEAIARLDDKLYRLQVMENEAAYKREKARLAFLDQELQRAKELVEGAFASKSHIDKLRSDRDVAESEYAVVSAKLQFAKEMLARYQVIAPYDGVVTERKRRVGEWVRSGDTVVAFSNPSRLEIEAHVTEQTVTNINVGQTLKVKTNEGMKDATVSAIVPVGDRQSLLFDLRLKVQGAWRAGQAVRVSVPTGSAREVLAIPRDALVVRRSGMTVFVIDNENKAQRVSLDVGIAGGELVEAIGSLKVGDRVVIRGGERLRPGQQVKIANP